MKEAFNVMDHNKKKYIAVDRISELPDPLLQEILSFLPTKQIVQSTILSKRWKHITTSIPVLESHTFNWDIESGYFNFLEKTLRSLSVKKFTLTDGMDIPKSVSRLDRWMSFAVKSDVEELNLTFVRGWDRRYQLPQSVFLAKSLTVLTLNWCKLHLTCGDININLPSLRKLSLYEVYTDDQTIHKLVAGCPVIQDMRFQRCRELKNIKFEGLTKAKSIEVAYNDDLERIELEASNLYSLYINQEGKNCEINLVSCNNVKMLTLSVFNITDEWFHDYFSQLPLIEYLNLHACRMLERIRISSHSLKTLYLMDCYSYKLVEVNIDTPNLRKFEYYSPTVIPFFSNALALSEATYRILKRNALWNVKKIEFFAKLNNSKLLTLKCHSVKVFLLSFIHYSFSYLHYLCTSFIHICYKFVIGFFSL